MNTFSYILLGDIMKLTLWHIAGFIYIILIGTFLHFAYDLSGQNYFVGYFSAVNESVWEHLKLIFWPAVTFSIVEFFVYGKNEADFFAVKMCSVVAALVFIVAFFYTYSGVLGFSLALIDIASFFVSSFICQYISYRLLLGDSTNEKADSFRGFVVLMLLGVCFVLWTYAPPSLGIFWG